jgi:hypothetical protein
VIGGAQAGAGNLISANGSSGIILTGADATGCQILSDFIGTDATGTAALPNTLEGIDVLAGASHNAIGGTAPGSRNVIGGNDRADVYISDPGSDFNVVEGNFIGTDVTGTVAFPQVAAGVRITNGAAHNTVGGLSPGKRNVVTGGYGIQLDGGDGNQALGNYINVDVTGEVVLGSALGAISGSGPDSLIEGNVVSGSQREGIYLVGPQAVGAVIRDNFIGTDATGTRALGNREGIRLDTQVTGALVLGNLIAGNRSDGIDISGEYGPPGFDNLIVGNLIGTDVSGTKALGNGGVGIGIGGPGNTVGGTSAADRNVIAANARGGVYVGNGASSAGNVVEGNYIGTDVTGMVALGNGGSGVTVGFGASDNTVTANVIAASADDGVSLFAALNTVVRGNFIGTNAAAGAGIGNGRFGVQIAFDGSNNNVIGGGGAGEGNVITNNGAAGVTVADNSTGNAIRGNSIYANGGLGIDLGRDGVTPNDPGHGNSGPNNLEHFPVVVLVRYGTITRAVGGLQSLPDAKFTIDFYASAAADPSGYEQGQRYLGSTTVTTDDTGLATFASLPLAVGPSEVLTATATDAAGNTSEFSRAVVTHVVSRPVIWVNPFGGDWDRPANWVDMVSGELREPGAGDDAAIDLGFPLAVTHAAGTADAARSLLSEDVLTLSAGSLSLAAASSVDAALTLSGGASLSGAGSLGVAGPLTVSSAAITMTGDQTYSAGVHTSGAAALSGANVTFLGGLIADNDLTVHGNGTVAFHRAVTAGGALTLTNDGGATLFAGALTAAHLKLHSAGATSFGAGVSALGGLDTNWVTSDGGNTTFAGALTAHDPVTITSAASTVFGGAVSVDAALNVTSKLGATRLALGAALHAGRAAFTGALVVAVAGTVPVSLYTQLVVTDGLALSGPLTLSFRPGYVPDVGSEFRIADNRGTSPVGGTFDGLPEGALLLTTHGTFRASYHGGDGNDVELTVIAPTAGGLSFTVDTGVPGDGITSDRTPTILGSGTPGTAVTVYRDGQPVGTTPAGPDGSWSFPTAAPLADGTYDFTATATDLGGNRSAPSAPLHVVIVEPTPPTPLTALDPPPAPERPANGTGGAAASADQGRETFAAGVDLPLDRGGGSTRAPVPPPNTLAGAGGTVVPTIVYAGLDGASALAEAAAQILTGARALALWSAPPPAGDFRGGGPESGAGEVRPAAEPLPPDLPSPLLLFGAGKPLGLNNTVPEGEEGPAVIKRLFAALHVADPQSAGPPVRAAVVPATPREDVAVKEAAPDGAEPGTKPGGAGALRALGAVWLAVGSVLGGLAAGLLRRRKPRPPAPFTEEGSRG